MSNSLLASNIPIQPRTAEPIIHIYSTLGMLAPAQTIHSIASRVSKKADSDLENKFLINLHLLKAYANAQLMSKAETLLKEILENPVQPTWLSGLWEVFHIMLSAYAHLKDPKSAFKLVEYIFKLVLILSWIMGSSMILLMYLLMPIKMELLFVVS